MPIDTKGIIKFDEANHTYTNTETGEQYISVTQLLKKHGLTTDYSNVPTATLKKAAERGTLIHAEIENYIKTGELGFTDECLDFSMLCDIHGLLPNKAEFIVYNAEYKIAGTVDNMGYNFIGDNKTTAKLNMEALTWQLNIYKFLAEIKSVNRLVGFHLLPDSKSKVVEVAIMPTEQVVELLEAEKNGEKYNAPKKEIIVPAEQQVAELQRTIEYHKAQAEEATKKLNEMTAAIIEAMKANGVKKFESKYLTITYIAPTTSTALDGTRLKKELPELAEKYSKTIERKESVRITLRGDAV